MNKWMKHGMIGLAMTSATVAAPVIASADVAPQINEEVMVDALDFAGGSKLKDRMVVAESAKQLEIVLIEIQA